MIHRHNLTRLLTLRLLQAESNDRKEGDCVNRSDVRCCTHNSVFSSLLLPKIDERRVWGVSLSLLQETF